MKRGTHNLGPNRHRQLAFVKIDDDGVLLQLGSARVVLSHEQAQLLKDVLA